MCTLLSLLPLTIYALMLSCNFKSFPFCIATPHYDNRKDLFVVMHSYAHIQESLLSVGLRVISSLLIVFLLFLDDRNFLFMDEPSHEAWL